MSFSEGMYVLYEVCHRLCVNVCYQQGKKDPSDSFYPLTLSDGHMLLKCITHTHTHVSQRKPHLTVYHVFCLHQVFRFAINMTQAHRKITLNKIDNYLLNQTE